jgi:hypothetical protein
MLRLILAIIAGMVIITILSVGTDTILEATGIFPPLGEPLFDTNLLLLATVYRFIYQVVGSYISARIAKERASAAAWTMGIIGAVMWLIGTFTMEGHSPYWYGILGAVLSIPSTLLGRRFYKA